MASRASARTSPTGSPCPAATLLTAPRSTLRTSTCNRAGKRIAGNRSPQSTTGTYTSSAPWWPGSTTIRIVPTEMSRVSW